MFGLAATLAALEHGDDWLAAQLEYLRGNRDLVEKEIGFPMAHVEATYLAWIDCSSVEDAAGLFLKHGVSVYGGAQFGDAALHPPELWYPKKTFWKKHCGGSGHL